MKIRDFIKENRTELDECINRALNNPEGTKQNDEARRDWIMNDEGLYNWARSEGVKI